MATNLKKSRRNSWLKKKYGLSEVQVLDMLLSQGGRCPLCYVPITLEGVGRETPASACVDHCHRTGRVRAVLCRRCNTGLGMFQESPAALVRAAEYLERHK